MRWRPALPRPMITLNRHLDLSAPMPLTRAASSGSTSWR